jgi:hypothetical protein
MAHAIWFFVAIVIALVFEAALVAKTTTVGGVILTLGSDRVQTVWPNARVTLKNLDTNNEVATVSNEVGRYDQGCFVLPPSGAANRCGHRYSAWRKETAPGQRGFERSSRPGSCQPTAAGQWTE